MTSGPQSTGVADLTWTFGGNTTITSSADHGLSVGDPILFYDVPNSNTAINENQIYYVKTTGTTTTVEISEIPGGTAITHVGTDSTTRYVSGKNINSARFQVTTWGAVIPWKANLSAIIFPYHIL